MPQFIPLLITAFQLAPVWFQTLIITTAANLALSKIAKALAPNAPRALRSAPIDIEYFDTVASRRILYGQNKISGLNTIPPLVTGGSGEQLHQVLTLAGHEVHAIDDVFFDTEIIGTRDANGTITSGTFSGKASVRKYTGTSTQAVDPILDSALTEWTSDHRGRGISYLAITYDYDTKVYRNGKPEITAIVRGKKCYDPRLDTSPGANPTSATYAAYVTNPALCLADYLLASYGLSESAARIDWALVVAAANICDEDVAIPGSITQKRYTCSVVLEATSDYELNIETLARAMMGVSYYSGGKWRMYAGSWSSSAFTLTEADIIGEVSIQTATSRKGEGFYNAVRGRFIDPERNYQAVEFEPILNSTYETADGERIYTEVDFAACGNQYEAQRNAILLSKQSRRQRTVSAVFAMSAYKIRPYETGTVTIAEAGWANQPVRCVGWRFRPEPAVELVLQEAGSADFSDPTTGTYVTPASVSVTNPVAYRPGTPSSFTATPEIESILLSWVAPSNTVPGILYQLFEHTSITPFAFATKIYEGADVQVRVPKSDTTTRYYWVRAFWPSTGGVSDESPSGNGLSSAGRVATVTGYITNEAISLPADSGGTVSSFAAAIGEFKVLSGTTDVTSLATFSVVSQTDCTGEINTATNTPVSGQARGFYRITALSADLGRLTVRAVYEGVTTDKVFTVAKAKAGANGTNGTNGNRGAGVFSVSVGASGTGYNISSGDATLWDGGTLTDALAQEAAAYVIAVSGNGAIEARDVLTIAEASTRAAQRIYVGTRRTSTSGVVAADWSSKVTQSIDGSLIVTGTLSAAQITTGTLSASRVNIDGLSLTNAGGQLAIASNGVTTTLINDGAVTGGKLGDGSVTGGKLASAAVDLTKFASNIRPVEIVGTLPTTGNVEGRTVYLTADGKLYRWTGSAFISTVPAADITGTLATSQIADASLTVAKFASGLRPVEVVGTLPTSSNSDGRMVFLTTDKKLYRYSATAGAFIKSVDGGDITANSIVAGSIQAGAIGADQLAANSVRTDKLLVTGRGASLNADPGCSDASAWNGSPVIATVTDGPSGNTAILNAVSLRKDINTAEVIPIERTKRYRVEAWVRQNAGTGGTMYLGIAFLDSTKTLIDSNVAAPAGWSNGTYSYFGRVGQGVTSTFTRYLTTFGPDEVGAIPANARYVQLIALLNFDSTAGVQHALTGFRLMEKADADLIVDGSVVASKISSGAVTTDKMSANSINGDRILANSLSASKIVANSITAGQVQAGAIGATELAARSISAEKLRIGSLDNLISNGNFATGDLSDMRAFYGTWSVVLRNASGVPAGAASTNVAKAVAAGTEASLFTGAKAYTDTDSFLYSVQCKPGEVFYISADVAAQSGTTGSVGLYAWHFIAGTGATAVDYTAVQLGTLSTSWQTLSGRFVVPAGVIGFWLYIYHSGLSAAGTTFTSNLRVIRAATGELVVDGAITAAKLEADLVLASTFKTAASGYRTEISNSGSYPIWYGTGTKNDTNGLFFVKTDGTVYFKGTVGSGSKIEIFTVTVAAISGTASGAAGSGNVTSGAASVTLTNGTASYTYDWVHVGQILGEIPTCSSATAAAPTFTRNAVDANEPSTSIWRCTVTDSKGNVASSQAYVRLIWVDTR